MAENKTSRLLPKLVVAAIVVAVAAWAVVYFMRPVAVVEPAISGRAINAVPGSVTVSAEYQMELKSEIGGRVLRSIWTRV